MAHYPGEKPRTDYEVDCAIEEWHDLSSDVRDMMGTVADTIPNYLGWTWDEYAQYVYDGTIPKE